MSLELNHLFPLPAPEPDTPVSDVVQAFLAFLANVKVNVDVPSPILEVPSVNVHVPEAPIIVNSTITGLEQLEGRLANIEVMLEKLALILLRPVEKTVSREKGYITKVTEKRV